MKKVLSFLTLITALAFSLPAHSQTFTLQAEEVITLFWNSNAAPAITDLNGDGVLDVFIGGENGYQEYWFQDGYHSNSFRRGSHSKYFNGGLMLPRPLPTLMGMICWIYLLEKKMDTSHIMNRVPPDQSILPYVRPTFAQ